MLSPVNLKYMTFHLNNMEFIFLMLFLSTILPSQLSAYSTVQSVSGKDDLIVTSTSRTEAFESIKTTSSSNRTDGTKSDQVTTAGKVAGVVQSMGLKGRMESTGDGPRPLTMRPVCKPPTCGGKITIPAVIPPESSSMAPATTNKPTSSTFEASSRHIDIISSVSPPGTRYNTDNTVATTTDSGVAGGLTTMAAFTIGLVIGISGFFIFGVLAGFWFVWKKKNRKADIRSRSIDSTEPEPTQYRPMYMSPTQTTFVSDGLPMANHAYEEATIIPGRPMTPHSPPVPSRVPESRYSPMPGEVVLSPDGYARYRPSVSEQIAERPQQYLTRMYRTLPRQSESTPNNFMDAESSAGRMRSYSSSAAAYTALNLPDMRRPTVIAQDGYAEYVSDDMQHRSRSYSELYTSNPRPNSPTRGYAKYKGSSKPSVYTDLTTGQKQPDGYAKYNASIHQHRSAYSDLRSGQDRRLPSPPAVDGTVDLEDIQRMQRMRVGSLPNIGEALHVHGNSIHDYTTVWGTTQDRRLPSPPGAENTMVSKRVTQRQVSVGSLPSINEALDGSVDSELGDEQVGSTSGRIISSDSDDSAYTNPNCDVDRGSLSYEEVSPKIISSPVSGVYIDLDDYSEQDECNPIGPGLCRNPSEKGHYYFKFQKGANGESQTPQYFTVGDFQPGTDQIEGDRDRDNTEGQSLNEGPYYFRVGSVRGRPQETTPTCNDQDDAKNTNETMNQSEPSYFQLEKPSTENGTQYGDLKQGNGQTYEVRPNSARNASISFPIRGIGKTEYGDLKQGKGRSYGVPSSSTRNASISFPVRENVNTEYGGLQQANNGQRFETKAHSMRKTSISFPITENVNSEYSHLVRSQTLPPVMEPLSHYQELSKDKKF